MTAADYHPGPAFDVLGKLRAAEAAISRVKVLADEWEQLAGEESRAWEVYGPQTISVPAAVREVRAALRGDA